MSGHRPRRLGLVSLALLAVGCGSTVTGTTATGGSAGLNANGSQNLSAGGTTAGPNSQLPGGGTSQPSGGGVAGSGTSGGSGGGGSASIGSSGNVTKQALTATTVNIGIGYVTNGDAANAAIGASGISQGDPKGEAQAVVNYINNHGGVAGGRKLVPVWQPYDATSTSTPASQDQAACANYTQDHRVFAVADSGLTTNLAACLLKAGVFMDFSGDIISHDNGHFHKYPNYVDVGTLSEDRFMNEEVQVLQRQKWFSPWDTTTGQAAPTGTAKIGVLTINNPWWDTPVDKILLPALKKAGHPAAGGDVFRVTYPQTTDQEAQTVSDIQTAALRFRSDGVTHVVFTDPNGLLTLIFSRNAQGQRYFPRYGVSSGSGMEALVTAGDVDPSTLKGAIGLAWDPSLDLTPAASAHYQTPATAFCLKVLKQAGYTFPDVNSQGIALSTCDTLFFLADVINRAAPNFNLASALNAVAGIGSSFHPANEPLAFLSATRHDALQEGWDMEWDSSCSCAKYLGNGYQIPDVND
jgi:hypothetical protein